MVDCDVMGFYEGKGKGREGWSLTGRRNKSVFAGSRWWSVGCCGCRVDSRVGI